jgi:hypothetical protein
MRESNGNEKFAELSASVPPSIKVFIHPHRRLDAVRIHWSFSKSFQTTCSSTTVGRVDGPAGLELALGSGDVDVTFEGGCAREAGGQVERAVERQLALGPN